jgi:hypothetical protein
MDTLLDLAVLCYKYDIIGPMRKLFDLWMQQWEETNEKNGKHNHKQDKGLYVAWVFGKRDLFDSLLDDVVRHSAERSLENVDHFYPKYSWVKTYYFAKFQEYLPSPIVGMLLML